MSARPQEPPHKLFAGGLFDVTAVGALTITDVPVSAVDFHVSSIVEELLEDAEIAGQLKVQSLSSHFGIAGQPHSLIGTSRSILGLIVACITECRAMKRLHRL